MIKWHVKVATVRIHHCQLLRKRQSLIIVPKNVWFIFFQKLLLFFGSGEPWAAKIPIHVEQQTITTNDNIVNDTTNIIKYLKIFEEKISFLQNFLLPIIFAAYTII